LEFLLSPLLIDCVFPEQIVTPHHSVPAVNSALTIPHYL
jgi:hypothetical protein